MLQKLRLLFNRRNSKSATKIGQYPAMSANEWGDLYQRDPKLYQAQLNDYIAVLRLNNK